MRVIMTKSRPGSEDGIHVQRYKAGEVYDVSDALGLSFIKSKSARPAPEAPMVPGSDDNKSGKGPDENKSS